MKWLLTLFFTSVCWGQFMKNPDYLDFENYPSPEEVSRLNASFMEGVPEPDLSKYDLTGVSPERVEQIKKWIKHFCPERNAKFRAGYAKLHQDRWFKAYDLTPGEIEQAKQTFDVQIKKGNKQYAGGSVNSCVNCFGASCRSSSSRHLRFLL